MMFVFAPLVAVLGWVPYPSVQVFTSGLACLCGLYMSLWIPTNRATGMKDPGPVVILVIFCTCSFTRLTSSHIGFEGFHHTVLLTFNLLSFLVTTALIARGLA